MDLSTGEWALAGLMFVWASVNALGEPLAGFLGAFAGGIVITALMIGAKRQISDWRRAHAADT